MSLCKEVAGAITGVALNRFRRVLRIVSQTDLQRLRLPKTKILALLIAELLKLSRALFYLTQHKGEIA
ncbi:MAG: hypothetical protein JO235_02015 [Chroococcidiopsidaceae cyanobacterium CP_BM_RX_35]|nr:hypothetical protein [Chroococcidiopsidaceae cyanobacterium CP_BM_RX_35]